MCIGLLLMIDNFPYFPAIFAFLTVSFTSVIMVSGTQERHSCKTTRGLQFCQSPLSGLPTVPFPGVKQDIRSSSILLVFVAFPSYTFFLGSTSLPRIVLSQIWFRSCSHRQSHHNWKRIS